MNKKDERIRHLWERGIRDPRQLARKLGYTGGQTDAGIGRVKEALKRLNIQI